MLTFLFLWFNVVIIYFSHLCISSHLSAVLYAFLAMGTSLRAGGGAVTCQSRAGWD